MNPMYDGYVPPCPSPTVAALAGLVAGVLLAPSVSRALTWLRARGR